MRCPLFWQGQKDLNPRHAVLETAALPTELYPYIKIAKLKNCETEARLINSKSVHRQSTLADIMNNRFAKATLPLKNHYYIIHTKTPFVNSYFCLNVFICLYLSVPSW